MTDPPAVALVTGGGSGIGAACVRALAAIGHHVVVADLDETSAKAVAGEVDGVVAATNCADPDSVDEAVRRAVAHGRLVAAVNSAGVSGPASPLGDYSNEDWRRVLAVNLDGVFFSTRAQVRAMRDTGGGSIVNIASVFGAVGAPLAPAYTAAKHGVVGLTRSAALAHAADGIRVNAIGPGFVRTPMLEQRADAGRLEQLTALHPLGRLGTPDDVASLAVWLCGAGSQFVTGGFFPVDGGYLSQ